MQHDNVTLPTDLFTERLENARAQQAASTIERLTWESGQRLAEAQAAADFWSTVSHSETLEHLVTRLGIILNTSRDVPSSSSAMSNAIEAIRCETQRRLVRQACALVRSRLEVDITADVLASAGF